jgi:hypothetical protein
MKLTEEKIELAAKAAYERGGFQWSQANREVQQGYRHLVLVAAPFLQMPLELPTNGEVEKADRTRSTIDALTNFVRDRNAALAPKPVDPRREKVRKQVRMIGNKFYLEEDTANELTDRILAALDEKE